eukprot:TRINITY_DN4365_c0_g1_i2.p1 TRINITY_DN4365_c0_g1~~TRINITY_DN4365_c0_g1_i2.p1  ORF type:complete len:288 (+),score=60.19 TRINITY_DN4365_c0_g1_i2:42-866(+)
MTIPAAESSSPAAGTTTAPVVAASKVETPTAASSASPSNDMTPTAEVPKKKIKILGFELSASEKSAKKALVGATALLVVVNGLGLPFILPKLRVFLGAPYVPMKRNVVEVLFDRVLPTWASGRGKSIEGMRLVDIGSGDGRIVAAAASKGMHASGYELNPYLCLLSRLRNRQVLAAAPGTASFRWANAWSADLSKVDVVTIYGRPGDGLMERTAAKCEEELPRNAVVVSHFFDIPGWERLLVQDVEGLKLYDLSLRRGRGPVQQGASSSDDNVE